MNLSIAYLLVFHGSRYAVPAIAAARLAQLLTEQLPNPLVTSAALELATLPLHQNIIDFAQVAIADGYEKIQIIPLFLSQGVHVTKDIPEEIAQAQDKLGSKIKLELVPALGSYPEIFTLLAQQSVTKNLPNTKKILLAHGSRLAAGNCPYEIIADKLNAVNAYWVVKPDLKRVIQSLAKKNIDTIEIILYFLFPGKITQAIADQVTQLRAEFPQMNLLLNQPLDATPELANFIIENLDVKY